MLYVGVVIFFLGLFLALVGWVWLIVLGFRKAGAIWGIFIIFLNWLAGLFYCVKYRNGWIPFGLLSVGLVLAIIGNMLIFLFGFCCEPGTA